MTRRIVSIAATLLVLLALWPEFGRYRAEHALTAANLHLDRILRSLAGGTPQTAGAAEAEALARSAADPLPGDPRPPLLAAIASMLQGRADTARDLLLAAIAAGERAELAVNLGRARTVLGDTAGANAAYLRAAWASPAAIATLPAPIQAELRAQVAILEAELRAGRLREPPGL